MCTAIRVVFHHIQVSTPGDGVREGRLTHKEPNEQCCKAGEEEEPHNDSDQDAPLVVGWFLLFAGQEIDPLVAAILALMRRKTKPLMS